MSAEDYLRNDKQFQASNQAISPQDNLFGDKKIQIVRNVGDLNSAYLPEDGTTIHRAKSITIKDIGIINCATYDQHFLYHHRYIKNGKPIRGWTLWCTCSSPSVVVGYDAYAKDASKSGAMIVCYMHATTGRHADGTS